MIQASQQMKALSLALHCCVLNDALLKVLDGKEEGQRKLFKLTTKQREEFQELATALRFVNHWTEKGPSKFPKPKGTLYDYDGLMNLESMKNMYHGYDFDHQATILEEVSKENPSVDLHKVLKFITAINSHALWIHNQGRCF